MTELRHENIVPFVGASVECGGVFILTAYCARGSLEDVLLNRDFKLDAMFTASLVADLIKVAITSISTLVNNQHCKMFIASLSILFVCLRSPERTVTI